MAKFISEPVTVTVEHGDHRKTYQAGGGSLSGVSNGYVDMSFRDARLIQEQVKPFGSVWAGPKYAHLSPPEYVKPAAETALIGAAKAQERATLNAGRLIEKAHEQAEALINDADHVLNSAIQSYLHTGKSAVDVARVLDRAGIYHNEVGVDSVATLDVSALYKVDATELLTVG